MLTEKNKAEILEAMKKYQSRRCAVMDAMMIAQKATGSITQTDMEDIARLLEMNPVEVNAAASFYTMYNILKPVGRRHIQVCRNLPCSLLGAEHIVAYLERRLGIKTGETTSDNKFTLSTVECLGSCGTAPMMQINDDYHENLTVEKIDELLKSLE